MDILLSEIEVRVLGSLMEKSMTTPEYYPLSLNSLTSACNQKSNREPVVAYDETTVARAINSLREKQLAVLSASSRVAKYAEVFVDTRKLVKREAALLMVLMLRGPQTIGELRARTERAYRFEDLGEVEATLDELAESGYVVKLPRTPGRKESRYAHQLGGEIREPEIPAPEPALTAAQAEDDRLAVIEEDLQKLRQELERLRAAFEQFRQEFE